MQNNCVKPINKTNLEKEKTVNRVKISKLQNHQLSSHKKVYHLVEHAQGSKIKPIQILKRENDEDKEKPWQMVIGSNLW